MVRLVIVWLLAGLAGLAGLATGADVSPAPALKVLLCTGDYGMWAQDRAVMIRTAVDAAAPHEFTWETQQSYDLTRLLESPAYCSRFDVIVISDVAIGSITPAAQRSVADFVAAGGGLVWGLCGKGTLAFTGSEEAVAMPLAALLPVAYPDFGKAHPEAAFLGAGDPIFAGIAWDALTDEGAKRELLKLAYERSHGKGRVIGLTGGFIKARKNIDNYTYKDLPGGWDSLPALGTMWQRILQHAGKASPVRGTVRAELDQRMPDHPLAVTVAIDATTQTDDVRAAVFSIVALQQLYNEDGGAHEDLFLALNPLDWFDRRSQEVLTNTKGAFPDKAAFFLANNIRGIYMGDDSYGSYGKWDDAKYAEQVSRAVEAKKKWPAQLAFFQAGNEPPLDAGYAAFHRRFVGEVLKQAPSYQVIGPNRAFNLAGVEPAAMEFYLAQCGSTTDVLNWHTYAQPPSTVLAEARYWSGKASGRLRTPGPARVMFTESDAWNQGRSQFDYLMDRAFAFLPEPRIIGNFQYCMEPRGEGGTYRFGVLQPDGEFAANYNGYWAWRNLRGRLVTTTVSTAEPQDSLHALASISRDGKHVTVVAHYGVTWWRPTARFESAHVAMTVALPPGTWSSARSDISWGTRKETPGPAVTAKATVDLDLPSGNAVAITWTRE